MSATSVFNIIDTPSGLLTGDTGVEIASDPEPTVVGCRVQAGSTYGTGALQVEGGRILPNATRMAANTCHTRFRTAAALTPTTSSCALLVPAALAGSSSRLLQHLLK